MGQDTQVTTFGNFPTILAFIPSSSGYEFDVEDLSFVNTPDASFYYQGYNFQMSEDDNDFNVNGIGFIETLQTSPNDPYVTVQGINIRIHPTGNSRVINGVKTPLYAPCYIQETSIPIGTHAKYLKFGSDLYPVADVLGDGKYLTVYASVFGINKQGPSLTLKEGTFIMNAAFLAITSTWATGVVPTQTFDSSYGFFNLILSSTAATTGAVFPGPYSGATLAAAFDNPTNLDLIQVVNHSGKVIWSASFNGTVTENPVNPTSKALLARLEGETFAAAFNNPDNLDILQIIGAGGSVVYHINYLGVSSTNTP